MPLLTVPLFVALKEGGKKNPQNFQSVLSTEGQEGAYQGKKILLCNIKGHKITQ